MKIISSQRVLKQFIHNEKNLGFVPTMGSIHMGHISLVKKSLSQCNKTLVSIFINRPQFNNKSDFKKYPRPLKKDILVLKKTKAAKSKISIGITNNFFHNIHRFFKTHFIVFINCNYCNSLFLSPLHIIWII